MSTPFNPQTQSQPEKKKAGMGKKILLGGIGAIIILGMVGACSPNDNDTTQATTETQVSTQVESSASKSSAVLERRTAVQKTTEQQVKEDAGVPREYQNALKKAESYLKHSAFSYNGLYKQLTSEYGSGFPADAAQYAMDNVEVDWNEQAIKKAESYLKYSAFSEQGLYDQLTSEYGSGFTHEQAQHAISMVY